MARDVNNFRGAIGALGALKESIPARQMDSLPRLLYIGDVPVECSYHGSALLYRLLQDYPPEKLMILETGGLTSLSSRRLPAVSYRRFSSRGQRLQRTRLARWANGWFALRAAAQARALRRQFDGFRPEALLTIAHNFSWLAAAEIAEQLKIPLHLIVHDDWVSGTFVPPGFSGWMDRQFRRIYGDAKSRLCVSPFMEQAYRSKYDAAGHVLYPSRAKDCPRFDDPPGTYAKPRGPIVVAYAGNPGFREMLLSFAKCLERSGGQLLLFGPGYSAAAQEFARPNIHLQGSVSSSELIARLRKEADVLLAPMPFDGGARLSFPSKLTDYTAIGLPLLIWGPESCGAVRWARQYAPVADVVTTLENTAIEAALERLSDPEYRKFLGRASAEVGDRLFDHAVAVDTLVGRLLDAH